MTDYYPALRVIIAGALAIIVAALLVQIGMESAQWLGYGGLLMFVGGVVLALREELS